MKKFILTLFLFVSSFALSAQTSYKATLTEMYTWDKNSEQWELYQKNSDVNITVVVEEGFISVQAKKPSMYKVYDNTKEPIDTKSLKGYRYTSKDLRDDELVKIDVLVHKETQGAIISVINYSKGYNLRYFLTEIYD